MIILKFALALFTAIFVHEGGHAVMVKASGGDVTNFRPYPTEWHLGYVSWTAVEKRYLPSINMGGIIASNASIPISSYFIRKYPDEEYFRFWRQIAVWDFPAHCIMSFWQKDNDISQFCSNTEIPKSVMLGLSLIYLRFNKNMIFSDGKILFKIEI